MATNNMFESFIDSVLIIDDKEDEITDLKDALEQKDIWVTYLNPPKEKQEIDKIPNSYRNRKLLFFDLRINETASTTDNIAQIIRPLLRKIVGKNFGCYGIVMWTKHDNHIEEFKNKIQNDVDLYNLPLFVIALDKTEYLSKRKKYNDIFTDLEEKLKSNIASKFFISWSSMVQEGKDNTIRSIFRLVPDYEKQNKNLEFILFKIAQNHTGIPFDEINDYPIEKDANKAFNNILCSEINGLCIKKDINLFPNKEKISFRKKDNNEIVPNTRLSKADSEVLNIFSQLNSRLLIDETNISSKKIIPGTVYQIIESKNVYTHPQLPKDAIPIVIEMTPPCNFSKKNSLKSRLLSGYILKYDNNKIPKEDFFYKELMPIKLIDDDNIRMILFDFRLINNIETAELSDTKKYKRLFKANDKLFADILQKMSSYASRFGLSIIK